jgi:hypothetical protein
MGDLRTRAGLAALAAALSGCATIPDVTVPYYFPRSRTQFVVTQTIGCSKAVKGEHRILGAVMSAVPTTVNEADIDFPPVTEQEKKFNAPHQGHFQYAAFKGGLDDSDVTVATTADGRLSSINGTSAGQGGTVISDLVTIATAISAAGVPAVDVAATTDKACAQVDKYSGVPAAGDSKGVSVITLTYTLSIYYSILADADPTIFPDPVSSSNYPAAAGTKILLLPDPSSAPAYKALHDLLHDKLESYVAITSNKANVRVLPAAYPVRTDFSSKATLELNKVATVHLAVTGRVGDLSAENAIWAGSIAAPMRATYGVAIPKPNIFGKTAFGISLSDNGAITSLHYGSTNGAPDAASAAGAIAKALQAQTPEDKANDLKGKADLIAQQQRLVSCQVDPTTCK